MSDAVFQKYFFSQDINARDENRDGGRRRLCHFLHSRHRQKRGETRENKIDFSQLMVLQI